MKRWNSTLEQRTPLKRKTRLKAKTKLKPVSKKRAKTLRAEKTLTQELLEQSNGLCQKCGNPPDWRGLAKHEKLFRSHGGDPLDTANIILVCAKCHSAAHGIEET